MMSETTGNAKPMGAFQMGAFQTCTRKVTWREVGQAAEPGRYLFKFGWLTITVEDLAIWNEHPHATFTLVSVSPLGETPDEFRLGAFDLGAP